MGRPGWTTPRSVCASRCFAPRPRLTLMQSSTTRSRRPTTRAPCVTRRRDASASFSPQTSLSNPWAHVLSAPPLTHHLHILTPPTHTHSLSPTPIQCIGPRIADRSRDLAERHFSEPEPADAARGLTFGGPTGPPGTSFGIGSASAARLASRHVAGRRRRR